MSWHYRLRMLQNVLSNTKTAISTSIAIKLWTLLKENEKGAIKTTIRNFNSTESDEILESIKNYLQRTNYVSQARLRQILEAIFIADDQELYSTFFSNNPPASYFDFQEYALSSFQDFIASGKLTDYVRFSPKPMNKKELQLLCEDNIFL